MPGFDRREPDLRCHRPGLPLYPPDLHVPGLLGHMWPAIVITPVWPVHGAGRGGHVRLRGFTGGVVPLRAATVEPLTVAMLADLMVPP